MTVEGESHAPVNNLHMEGPLPLEAHVAGLRISRGAERHIERIASFFVLLFVRRGVLYIEEEGKEFVVREGESLLLWPGRHHQGTREFSEDMQFFWLHFTLNSPQEGTASLQIPQHAHLTRPDFVTELFRRYLDDQSAGILQPLGASLYAWLILLEVAAMPPSHNGSATASLARRVRTYIRAHHHERICVADVAEAVGYNAQYLGRIYRQQYQISLVAAIRRERISHAKWLLLETDHSISTIARLSGFEDISYFQRVFKQLEGITPLQFRRLHSGMNVNY